MEFRTLINHRAEETFNKGIIVLLICKHLAVGMLDLFMYFLSAIWFANDAFTTLYQVQILIFAHKTWAKLFNEIQADFSFHM